jgi:hypothetical protein
MKLTILLRTVFSIVLDLHQRECVRILWRM